MSERNPVRTTEPLKLEQLSDTELRYLSEINAVIRGISDHLSLTPDKKDTPRGTKADNLWGTVERGRTNNVLFIDGARGYGKTSLFLTLLYGWNGSQNRKSTQLDPLEVRAGFVDDNGQEIGPRVRFLDILDFDPIPHDMSVHAWLTGAWANASRIAEKYDVPRGGRPSCNEGETCRELWDKVMRQAIIAWSRPTRATNLVTQALDSKQKVHDWAALRRDWRLMVDHIVDGLERAGELQNKQSLIVVPIDDVDLQVERIAELLPALRLFDHPRVVYLLTGDLAHLKEMLRLDLHGRQVHLGGGIGHDCVDPCNWAKTLSHAAVEKTIPSIQTWFMEKPKLPDALKVLYRVEGVETQLVALIGDVPIAPALVIRPLSYRELERLRESLEVIRGQGREEHLGVVALAGLIGAWSPDHGVDHAPTRLPLRPGIDGHLLANGLVYLTLREGEGDVNVCFSAKAEFRFRPSWGGVSQDADRIAWSQVLFTKVPQFVAAAGIDWDANAVLAWTEVKAKSLTGLFVWPWAKNPDANELVERGRQWRKVLDASSSAGERLAFLAFAWILMQGIWTEDEGQAEELDHMAALAGLFSSRISAKKLWTDFLKGLITNESFDNLYARDALANPPYLDEWYRERLPAMAAPEFGLPREVQKAILEAYEDHLDKPLGTSRSLAEVLRRNRRAWMGDALYREAEYRDPGTQPQHTTEQEEQLLTGLDDRARASGAPWYQYVERSTPPTWNEE